MANLLEQDNSNLLDNVAHCAQRRVSGSHKHGGNWVWSPASHASGRTTAQLGFATFRQAGVLQGETTEEQLTHAFESARPVPREDSGFLGLLVDQAQGMVRTGGMYNRVWVESRASTAVSVEAGHLALEMVRESSAQTLDTKDFALLEAFSTMLESAGVDLAPSVREEIEIDRANLAGPAQ